MYLKVSEILDKVQELLKPYSTDSQVANFELKMGLNGSAFKLDLEKPTPAKGSINCSKRKYVSPSTRRRRAERRRVFLEKKKADRRPSETAVKNYLQQPPRKDTQASEAAIQPRNTENIETPSLPNRVIEPPKHLIQPSATVSRHKVTSQNTTLAIYPSSEPIKVTNQCDHYGKRLVSYMFHIRTIDTSFSKNIVKNFRSSEPRLFTLLWFASEKEDIPFSIKKKISGLLKLLCDLSIDFECPSEMWNLNETNPPKATPEIACLWCLKHFVN